jgi:hypothetical protein
LHSLANLFATLKRNQESEELYIQSINILKQRLGVSHPDVASFIQDFDRFKNKGTEENSVVTGTWGAVLAVGLISTAVFALKRLQT